MIWNNFNESLPPSNHAILLHMKDAGVFIAYTGEVRVDGDDVTMDISIENANEVCVQADSHWLLIPDTGSL